MPRGVPKAGFRKTKKWQQRQNKINAAKAKKKTPTKRKVSTKRQAPAKKQVVSEKPAKPQKRKKRQRSEKSALPDTDTNRKPNKHFLRNFQLKMEEYEEQCCETRVAYTDEVGACDFCTRPPTIRVLVITSKRLRPKGPEVKICRSCLSKCAMDRLDL